jgi:chromosome partitioning protein
MEVDPKSKSANEVRELWDYISDRLEKQFRRAVFSAPANNVSAHVAAPRPMGGFGRRVVGQ